MHETPLITTIVGGLVLAFILGSLANRLRLPPLVGYLIAGVLVGPYTPGFVADQSIGAELAELGVILLMFGVGLHFSLKDLMSVRALAIPGALVQIGFATLLGLGLGLLLGWGLGAGLIFGLALSVASTVVLLKAMQDRRLLETERGRIAVGWLIVEDLAMVLALVLIPAIAALFIEGVGVHDPFVSFVERVLNVHLDIYGVLALTVVKIAAFIGFMLIVGRRLIPAMLHATAHTGNRELFRLAVLAIALGVALGSAYLFGVSLALGAFFAGMILSESQLSQRAAQETLPLRDAFAVLFFVSVGMLFDPAILLRDPLPVLATVFIIIIGKSVAAFLIVLAFRRPVGTALTISASLAQIGEFSFILATMGVSLTILPEAARDLILAGALLSIILNPLVFFIVDRLRPVLERQLSQPVTAGAGEPVEPTLSPSQVLVDGGDVLVTPHDEQETVVSPGRPLVDDEMGVPTALSRHTVLVGYGRVGRVAAGGLAAAGRPFLIIEDVDSRIAAARDKGLQVIAGNGADPRVLDLANVAGAAALLVAIPNVFEAGQCTEQCRKRNGGLKIVARAHSDEEEDYLKRLGADVVVIGDREIGLGMLHYLSDPAPRGAASPTEDAEADITEPASILPALLVPLRPVEPVIVPAAQPVAEVAGERVEPMIVPAADALETGQPLPSRPVEVSSDETPMSEQTAEEGAQVSDPQTIAAAETQADLVAEAALAATIPESPVLADPGPAMPPSTPSTPSQPPAEPEGIPPGPDEAPAPSIPVEAPPAETPGTDPTPQEAPVIDPSPAPQELPGNSPVEQPEPEHPPVEAPVQPVPEDEPTPAEIPVSDPVPTEVPPVTPERRDDPPTVAETKD